MKRTKPGFPAEFVAAIDEGRILRIRAGTSRHRFIGIWAELVPLAVGR